MSEQPPEDIVWRRNEIESPCVQVCVVHPDTRLCIGCARSVDEISRWSRMTTDERRRITAELSGRTAAPTSRRGGRAARQSRKSR